jgi:hypothetical protein
MVSDIKLYNPDAVAKGVVAGDLYTRLKDSIDQAVALYETRLPAPIREEFDYLQDELVRQLAGGDASKLGPNFRGTRRG